MVDLTSKRQPKFHPKHRGKAIKVGRYFVGAGAARDLTKEDCLRYDILINLTDNIPPLQFGREYRILAAPLKDYGGVPPGWEDFLRSQVVPLLENGKRILAFCEGGHGRTGCFLGSLVSILEPETEDPIAAVRERHCREAVETIEQARAIFALRGEPMPPEYHKELSWKHFLRIEQTENQFIYRLNR